MSTKVLDRNDVLKKYPAQKPVCLNYATMRAELLALAVENEALRPALPERSVEE